MLTVLFVLFAVLFVLCAITLLVLFCMRSSTVFSSFPRLFAKVKNLFQEFELALASHISLPDHAKGDLEAGLRTAFNITEDEDEGRAASSDEQELLAEFLVESRHQSSSQDAEQEMIKAEGRKRTGRKGGGRVTEVDTGRLPAFNGPLIYTASYVPVMLLMRANPLRGQGWALEIKTVLGPLKWHRVVRRVPFEA
jgi:hypothetical protein